MPYPPSEAWYVDLGSRDDTTFTVVLAQHQDLYNAEWAVHELPADPKTDWLRLIGATWWVSLRIVYE